MAIWVTSTCIRSEISGVKLYTEYVFGWQGASLCIERGGNYSPNRGKGRCLFPRSAQWPRGKGLGSWLARFRHLVACCHGARFLPLALRIQTKRFGPGDGHLSIKIMSIMIFVVSLVYQSRMEDLFPHAAVVWS